MPHACTAIFPSVPWVSHSPRHLSQLLSTLSSAALGRFSDHSDIAGPWPVDLMLLVLAGLDCTALDLRPLRDADVCKRPRTNVHITYHISVSSHAQYLPHSCVYPHIPSALISGCTYRSPSGPTSAQFPCSLCAPSLRARSSDSLADLAGYVCDVRRSDDEILVWYLKGFRRSELVSHTI